MNYKPLLWAACVAGLIGLSACDDAPEAEKNADAPADEQSQASAVDESIIAALPAGFVEAHKQRDPKSGAYIIEYVPEGQSIDDWKEIITVQFFQLPEQDPEAFYREMGMRMSQICTGFSMEKPRNLDQEPFKVTIGGTYCGTNPQTGKGEITGYAISKGVTGLHILQRAIKTDPFERGEQPFDNAFYKEWWGDFSNASKLCSETEGQEPQCIRL